MNITEIEAELKCLSAEDLRRLAVRSWEVYVQKEGAHEVVNECEESDPELLAALDEAVRRADAPGGTHVTADELRDQVRAWTTK